MQGSQSVAQRVDDERYEVVGDYGREQPEQRGSPWLGERDTEVLDLRWYEACFADQNGDSADAKKAAPLLAVDLAQGVAEERLNRASTSEQFRGFALQIEGLNFSDRRRRWRGALLSRRPGRERRRGRLNDTAASRSGDDALPRR